MQIRLRKEAAEDLIHIRNYYDEIAPDSTNRVLSDIFATIVRLKIFPSAGSTFTDENCRRVVSAKDRFKIAYIVTGQTIDILGVFRQQNRQV